MWEAGRLADSLILLGSIAFITMNVIYDYVDATWSKDAWYPGRLADSLILLGAIAFITMNVIYDYVDVTWSEDAWYQGQAFAFVCYAGALVALRNNVITWGLLAIVSGQFLDEIISEPTIPNVFEYIGLSFVVVISIFKTYARNGKSRS